MSDLHFHKLSNGLQVIAEHTPSRKSACIGFFVRSGSRDETVKESGVSHFLEHMMFKGTAKRSALDISYSLGRLGAQANAFTSEENTVYYSAILPEYFSEMQELLSDMLRPALDQQEYDTEKKVILEEIALYQDRPHFYLFENSLRDYFSGHPAGNSVLGSNSSISALSRDEMQNYFDRRYASNNITLVATGQFDADKFLADTEKLCGHWKSFEAPRESRRYNPVSMQKVYKKKNLTQNHVLLVSEGVSAQDEERFAFSLLAAILGDSSGSKLYWELVDKGLAEGAGADNDERDGLGIFMAYASTTPDRIEQVTKILQKVLANPMDFSEQDLEQAKNKFASRIVLNGELPMGRLMSIGNEWTYRAKVESLADVIARLKAVTKDEIGRALEKFPLKVWSQFRLISED